MKKNLIFKFVAFFALLSSMLLMSCEKYSIEVSTNTVTFDKYSDEGSSYYISVDANVYWSVSVSSYIEDYITIENKSDHGFYIVYTKEKKTGGDINGYVTVGCKEDPLVLGLIDVYISPKSSGSSSSNTNNNTNNNNNNSNNSNNNNNNFNDDSYPTPEPEDDPEPSNKKPSAPTGVSVSNYGSVSYPDVRISWNSVSSATKYYVYRSTSAYGSYSYYAQTSNTYYTDNSCRLGNTYYYKVKAYNSAGESDYSDYAMIEMTDTRKPGLAQYGSCYVSGSKMSLSWSVPTHDTYGKPTKAIVKVYEPYIGDWMVLDELSGTTTSYSFYYGMYVDEDGYVKVGVILENENGSGGGTPKVYDTNSKRFIN